MRTIHLVWSAPTTGPTPTHYVVREWHPVGGKNIVTLELETIKTEAIIRYDPYEHFYSVRSVVSGLESADSLPTYLSFAITDIDIRDNGVVVTFATEPGKTYHLDMSTDGTTWREIANHTALPDEVEVSLGGDASEPSARYRVREAV